MDLGAGHPRSLILLSGGLDSAVLLAQAIEKGRKCIAITFTYGQQHAIEIESAKKLAAYYDIPHHIIPIDPTLFGNAALLGKATIPQGRTPKQIDSPGIPSTYVPARNTLFLAYATALAEVWEVQEIYFGANASDFHGYPDTRPAFLASFQSVLNTATAQAVGGSPPQLITPLQQMDKPAIVQEALRLALPIELTWSCYAPTSENQPCNICDACVLRHAALKPELRPSK